jgi:hypothetical protein
MSQVDSLLLSIEGNTQNANSIKEMVIRRLLNDKAITEEKAKEYTEKWQIIIIKCGWFERWFKTLSGRKTDDYIYKYVRFED